MNAPALRILAALVVAAIAPFLPLSFAAVFAVAASLVALASPQRRLLLAALPPILALALAGRLRPDGSWELAALLALRGVVAVGAALLLVARLSESEVLRGLTALRVPAGALAVVAGMFRQRRSLERERSAFALAREARTLRLPSLPERWRTSAGVAAQIFVRSLVRAEQVGMAMAARGWTGAAPAGEDAHAAGP